MLSNLVCFTLWTVKILPVNKNTKIIPNIKPMMNENISRISLNICYQFIFKKTSDAIATTYMRGMNIITISEKFQIISTRLYILSW